ncbi:MAG: polysaccharide biosynthesis C-terminal domain-containing protein [Saprospiraceae bacterium]
MPATRITNYMEVPMSGLSQVIYPRIAMAHAAGDMQQIGRLYEKSIGMIVAILLPLVVVVLGLSEWVVVLVAGEKYASAAPLLNILTLAVAIKPWGRLFGITLDAIGKPQLNFALLAISLGVNIALNLLFIRWWGIVGAAWATLVAVLVLVVSGQVLIHRVLPVQQWKVWQYIFLIYNIPLKRSVT